MKQSARGLDWNNHIGRCIQHSSGSMLGESAIVVVIVIIAAVWQRSLLLSCLFPSTFGPPPASSAAAGQIGLLGGAVVMCFTLYSYLKGRRLQRYPELHPVVKYLSRRGSLGDWLELARREIDVDRIFNQFGPILVSPSFVFVNHNGQFSLALVSDLIWVYQITTQHSINFVPTGKSYAARLVLRDGQVLGCEATSGEVESFLKSIQLIAPWVVVGFTKELEADYRSNPVSFVQRVDEMRAARGAVVAKRTNESAGTREIESETSVQPVVLNLASAKCPYCGAVVGATGVVVCPKCQAPHHHRCWAENQNRCCTYGCEPAR